MLKIFYEQPLVTRALPMENAPPGPFDFAGGDDVRIDATTREAMRKIREASILPADNSLALAVFEDPRYRITGSSRITFP